jgi:hypothetical protein
MICKTHLRGEKESRCALVNAVPGCRRLTVASTWESWILGKAALVSL